MIAIDYNKQLLSTILWSLLLSVFFSCNTEVPSKKIINNVILKMQEQQSEINDYIIHPELANYASLYYLDEIGADKKKRYIDRIPDLMINKNLITRDELNKLEKDNQLPILLNYHNDFKSSHNIIRFSKIKNNYLFVQLFSYCDKVKLSEINHVTS